MRSNGIRVYYGLIYEMGCGRTLRYEDGLLGKLMDNLLRD
jgi:hypothetical protein